MADILINKFTTQIPRVGATPATPGFAESEGQDPVNPSGSPIQYGIGSGLSLDSLNQIQLGNDGAGVVDISGNEFQGGLFINASGGDGVTDFGKTFSVDLTANDYNSFIVAQSVDLVESTVVKKASTQIGVSDGVGNLELEIQISTDPLIGNYAIFTDEINLKGLEYAADYSANWTDHSLVTKSWVLDQVSGSAHTPVTIGSPANGLSISGTQVLTIGLASTSTTGALSSTDWNTFNRKIGGSIASGQVAFGTGVNTVGGSNSFWWDSVNTRAGIGTNAPATILHIRPSSGSPSLRVERASGTILNIDASTLAGGAFIRTGNSAPMSIGVNGAQDIFIDTSNRVGINNASPTNTLDVNGTARIRTISNLGTAATSVLVPSATGVVSLRTLAELASDAGLVTLTGTQTITGAKTFSNSLLVQSGSNPVFRIATTDNTAIINFRNVFNEDAATIQMSTPTTELAISTNVSNYDIRIQPHGTGKIKLPNVPSGTGDFLGRDASNNLVIVSGVSGSESSITPTLSDSGGGATYTFTQSTSWYYKVGRVVHFSVYITGIATVGTPTGSFRIAGLPRPSNNVGGYIDHSIGLIGQFAGSDLTTAELNMAYFDIEDNVASGRLVLSLKDNVNPPTSFTAGIIQVSGTYIVN